MCYVIKVSPLFRCRGGASGSLLFSFSCVWDNVRCHIRPDKIQEDRIVAVVYCQKRSDYSRNHSHSYSNGASAFVWFGYDWLSSSCMWALWGVGNRAIQPCSSQIIYIIYLYSYSKYTGNI